MQAPQAAATPTPHMAPPMAPYTPQPQMMPGWGMQAMGHMPNFMGMGMPMQMPMHMPMHMGVAHQPMQPQQPPSTSTA